MSKSVRVIVVEVPEAVDVASLLRHCKSAELACRGPYELQPKALEVMAMLNGARLNFLVWAEVKRRLKKLLKDGDS